MSNIVSESLNELDCHSFKMGDNVIKKYGNKEVKFTFVFNKKGKKLKDILEQCYQNEIRNEQILTGGTHELQKLRNDAIIQA